MNDPAKPDLKPGVPLSSIPEVGHRRRMQRKFIGVTSLRLSRTGCFAHCVLAVNMQAEDD
jgi:hypothetical protein